MAKELPGPGCSNRLEKFTESRLLLSASPVQKWLGNGVLSPELRGTLSHWSTDLLIRLTLGLQQEFFVQCKGSPKISRLLTELKASYIRALGIQDQKLSDEKIDGLFRGLVVLADDVEPLRKKIGTQSPDDVRALLAKTYQAEVEDYRGTWFIAPQKKTIEALKKQINQLCPKDDCAFWDSRLLFRVAVVSSPGVAAYLPEISALILSETLVDQPNLLHQVVLLHELSHMAAKRALWFSNRDWKAEFLTLSGWKREKGKWNAPVHKSDLRREDELTRLSLESIFSILPDAVYLGGPGTDGFVFGKSYEASRDRSNLEEDLCDHIAVFRYAPERFCFQGKPLAPRKFRWITENVFHEAPPLSCEFKH
jgi:hypothetical protein